MRIRIVALSCLVAGCTTGPDPASTLVHVEQRASPETGARAEASLAGDVLTVRGHYQLRYGCRALTGTLERKPGVLRLRIIGSRPRATCPETWAHYDYEATVGPLPPGSYQLTVLHTGAEVGRWPLPIVLRTDLGVK
jgi:hypothetical protein